MAKNEIPHTPSSYNTEIAAIPLHFQAFAFELAARTGWSFTLLAGGPDPANGGCINTAAVHFGEDMDGNSYGKSALYPKGHLTPFANFLQTVYTQEQCDARALNGTPMATLVSRPEATPFSTTFEPASITKPTGALPPNLLVCKPLEEGVDSMAEPGINTNAGDDGGESLFNLAGSIPGSNAPFWETFDFDGIDHDIPGPSLGLVPQAGYGSLMDELEAPLGVFPNYEEVTSPINNTVHEPQGSGLLQDFFLQPLTAPTPHAMPDAANTPIIAQAQELTNTTPIATPPSPVINANAATGIEPDEDVNQTIASEDAPDEAAETAPDTVASTKTTKSKAKQPRKRKARGTKQKEQPTSAAQEGNAGVATSPDTCASTNSSVLPAKPRRKRKEADDSHLIVNTKRKRIQQSRTEITALTDSLNGKEKDRASS
ncbi:hypothetical protein BDN71DRAFT_1446253 [Pleurotus eryngii]|uniref:Uncharacterized protein n=1 Tax=Pleurotus eryngii TaxID=5323 RepID=A0A9P6A300_PLEER|nr:hypothetical protein BDN71DRAFT_1446253 [Pleurotus eryngii]